MSKLIPCPEKSINQKEKCVKKTNLLVYKRDPAEECLPPKTYVPPISSAQVKRIKICTGAQLKKMCAPPPCPCPPKVPGPTLWNKLARLLGFGAKSLLALGAVYVTYDMGLWGDNVTTGGIYKSICNVILPSIKNPPPEKKLSPSCEAQMELFGMNDRDPYCCDKFPIDHESSVYDFQQKWNKFVTGTFSTIAGFPAGIKYYSQRLYCKVFSSEECTRIKEEEEKECCPCD